MLIEIDKSFIFTFYSSDSQKVADLLAIDVFGLLTNHFKDKNFLDEEIS